MKLQLKRIALRESYTIGRLFVDDMYVCDTLEDKVRDVNRNGRFDNGEVKIYGQTAIPYGTYDVTLKVKSPKFSLKPEYKWCNGYLPRLLGVPHFDGILIHAGNTHRSTAGCVLVGRNTVVGRLTESMATLKRLYGILSKPDTAGERIFIEIV